MREIPNFEGWTAADHVRASELALIYARQLRQTYIACVEAALKVYPQQGGLISGIVNAAFPTPIQQSLRWLCQEDTAYRDRSLAHWRAAGRRRETWGRV